MTENEIKFMTIMEKYILPNAKSISITLLKEAGSLIGVSVNASCRTCAQKAAPHLKNHYFHHLEEWNEYKKINNL